MTKFGVAMSLIIAAAAIGVGAVLLVLSALWLALDKATGPIGASLICAVAALCITGGLAWTARRLLR